MGWIDEMGWMGWMDGSMRWMEWMEWMGWMGWMDGWIDGWMGWDGSMDGSMDGWNRRMDRWTDIEIVILSGASRSFIARGVVEGPAVGS